MGRHQDPGNVEVSPCEPEVLSIIVLAQRMRRVMKGLPL